MLRSAVLGAGNRGDSCQPLKNATLALLSTVRLLCTGVDETSCFFVDDDGEEVEHGYYFDEVGFAGEVRPDNAEVIFSGGSFPYDLTRRKVKFARALCSYPTYFSLACLLWREYVFVSWRAAICMMNAARFFVYDVQECRLCSPQTSS